MKVALCLQGQPRNWKPSVFYMKKYIIDQYDTDVIGHTWWNQEKVGDSYDVAPFAPQYKKYLIEENTPEELQKSYNFKKFHFDSPKNFLTGTHYKVGVPEKHDSIVDALRSRYYSLKTVLTMTEEYEKENNIKYEWLCVARYDVSILNFKNLVLMDPRYMYFEDYLHSNRKYILNDNFMIFGRKHRYIFKTLFDDFDTVYNKMVNFDLTEEQKNIIKGTELEWEHVRVCNGEQMMAYHLLLNDDSLKYAVQSKDFRYVVIP